MRLLLGKLCAVLEIPEFPIGIKDHVPILLAVNSLANLVFLNRLAEVVSAVLGQDS